MNPTSRVGIKQLRAIAWHDKKKRYSMIRNQKWTLKPQRPKKTAPNETHSPTSCRLTFSFCHIFSFVEQEHLCHVGFRRMRPFSSIITIAGAADSTPLVRLTKRLQQYWTLSRVEFSSNCKWTQEWSSGGSAGPLRQWQGPATSAETGVPASVVHA